MLRPHIYLIFANGFIYILSNKLKFLKSEYCQIGDVHTLVSANY